MGRGSRRGGLWKEEDERASHGVSSQHDMTRASLTWAIHALSPRTSAAASVVPPGVPGEEFGVEARDGLPHRALGNRSSIAQASRLVRVSPLVHHGVQSRRGELAARRRRGHRIPPPIGARRAETHTPREAPCSSRSSCRSVDLSQVRARRGERVALLPDDRWAPGAAGKDARGAGANNHANAAAKIATAADARSTTRV